MRTQVSCWLAICLVGFVVGMPQGDKKPDDRVGLERPSTSPTPEISECGLDALIGDVFGNGGNANCNNNPAPDKNDNGYQPTPDNNNNGYQPNPNNNDNGYQPNPNNNDNGYQPPENGGAKDCECVPFYLCDDNNTIIEDGVGLIDIRLKDECGSYDQKCCGGSHVRPPDNPVITPRPPPPPDATAGKCGVRNFDGVGVRITGAEDNEAQYGEFPWMVAVVQPDSTRSTDGKPVNVYQCGGSLIHPQVVLTGAHCVRGKNNLVIRAGEWDTQTKNELYPTQDRKVREVIIHEQFNNNTLVNDPGLLILEEPVDTSYENVGLICLPEENEIMDGRDCVASGWGKDQFGKEGKYQVILKRVELPIVPRGPCLEALRKTRLGSHFKLHPSFICAGGRPGKDTCKGDGGSPLACPSKANPGVYVQAGIVAWGISCNTETPGVYVNVPSFISWINNKLQQRGIYLSCGPAHCNNYNDKNHNPDNINSGNAASHTDSAGGYYNSHSENSNSGVNYNPPTQQNSGGSYSSLSGNNNNVGSFNPPNGNNNNGGNYKPPKGNNNNVGSYNPPRGNNNNGGSYNPPSGNNNNVGSYNPPSGNNNNNGYYNPPSGNNNIGGSYNPPGGNNNNGGNYNPPSGNNNNGGSYNPPSGNNNNGGSYNPPSGNNNNGGDYNIPTGNNNNNEKHKNKGDSESPTGNNNSGGSHDNASAENSNNNGGGYTTASENRNSTNFENCKCVPFFLCEDSDVLEDGVGLLDIRIKDECGSYDQKCCDPTYIKTADRAVAATKPAATVPSKKKCGTRNSNGVNFRITGDEDNEAQYGEFPWMVAVVQNDPILSLGGDPVNVYQCGGSLIHPRVVLTGAHCVLGKSNLVVRAGEWDTQSKNEIHPSQDRKVQKVIIHEEFNIKKMINDPALLILEDPVDDSVDTVGLICLPEQDETLDGRDCVASGWGKDQFGKKGKYQVILKKVDLPIVPRDPCLEALRKTRLGSHFKLHPSFICAGGKPGKDTCKGDGGSPLACPSKANPEVYVQAGIVAWGISCNTETPGVYVNVPLFVNWIHSKLEEEGISLM